MTASITAPSTIPGWLRGKWRPIVAFMLCLAAAGTVVLDAPWRVAMVAVGAYCFFVPGLILDHLLRLRDPLLSLVVGLMVGPSAWVLLGTVLLFAGWWSPRVTLMVSATVLALASTGLALVSTQSTAAHAYRSRELTGR